MATLQKVRVLNHRQGLARDLLNPRMAKEAAHRQALLGLVTMDLETEGNAAGDQEGIERCKNL